jgi:hypothetical protein
MKVPSDISAVKLIQLSTKLGLIPFHPNNFISLCICIRVVLYYSFIIPMYPARKWLGRASYVGFTAKFIGFMEYNENRSGILLKILNSFILTCQSLLSDHNQLTGN